VGSFLISPDGTKLAVALDVFTDCPTLECTAKRLDEVAARKATGVIYDELFIRHWDTWSDHRRSHWHVFSVSGGQAVDVMRGMDADGPSKPFGGAEEAAFTPDGKSLIFTAKDVGREDAWSTNYDLFVAPVDASSPPRNLTAENKAWDTQPVFSPDGKTLAYLAMAVPGYEADRYRIKLMAWPAGTTRTLADKWVLSPSSVVWSRREDALRPTARAKSLFAIDVAGGAFRTW
jgi:dipeptidyl aminopeptidase/acylaminoacyl peptidase